MQAPTGTLISFATQPGSVAQDGIGGHSPYTRALATTLRKPGLGLFEVFNEVGVQVLADTGQAQQPWQSSSPIPRPFYFTPASGTPAVATLPTREQLAAAPPPPPQLAALPPPVKPIASLPVPAAKPLTPEAAKALKGGDAFKECSSCPVMVAVPPGTFAMGSPPSEPGRKPEEGPQQQITIAQMFAVGRSEVSFDEWSACVADGGCNSWDPGDNRFGKGKHPVIFVSWADAKAYVDWLSKKTGATYRLLSEAEREYVARGCTSACAPSPFWFGPEISRDKAIYDSRFAYAGGLKDTMPLRGTVETGTGAPNAFGLLHVAGNVREWVEDCWNPSLAGQPRDGSARTTGDCREHVTRGGSWADRPEALRSAARSWMDVDENDENTGRDKNIGFRVARTLER
jgi:formylglycine-generating enzyme required for sulfatase activity